MKGGFQLVDCNRHVVEPTELWQRLDPAIRGEVQPGPGPLELTVRGRPVIRGVPDYFDDPAYRQAYSTAVQRGFDAASNLTDMDAQGIDVSLLLPTTALYAVAANHVDAELAEAICRAYNDWLAEYVQADPRRLKGIALLPLQDVDRAAAELRRAVQQLGFVAGLFFPNPLLDRMPNNPAYDRLYQEAHELQAPLVVTQSPGLALPQIGQDRFESFFPLKAVAEPFEAWLAIGIFMGHNVVERFPNLKVGFAGAGCGWLACWLDRLEEHWGNHFGADAPSYLPPSHLFRTQGFAVCDPWERTVPEALEEAGEDTIVWGSSYPLPEGTQYVHDGVENILNDEGLSHGRNRRF